MLTLQSSKSRIVCLLGYKVKQDSLGDVILVTSQNVYFTEVKEGLNHCYYIVGLQHLSSRSLWPL